MAEYKAGDFVIFIKNKKEFIGIILDTIPPNALINEDLYEVQRFDNRESGYKHLFRKDELKPTSLIVKALYG
jgi:hypothetical protein